VVLAPFVLGANLLTNGSFDEPAVATACQDDYRPVAGWNNLAKRNGTFYIPTCPRDGDGAHATIDGWGGTGTSIHQTVTNLTAGTDYTLQGVWWVGCMDPEGTATATAELRDGPDATASPVLASAELSVPGPGDSGAWVPFSVSATPDQTAMTVVLRLSNQSGSGWALHVDDCILSGAACNDPVIADEITPTYGARGSTVTVTVWGSNFVEDGTAMRLTKLDQDDIVPTTVDVAPNGTSVTATLDLAGAAPGRWTVTVSPTDGECPEVALPNAFNVVMPAFTNGSFELPDPGNTGCSVAASNDAPSAWLLREIQGYGAGRALYRDEIDTAPPMCPPPDGDHYASSWSDNGHGAKAWIYQTCLVTPETEYTIRASFAGTGANTVTLELLDGDEDAPPLDSVNAGAGFGPYDWNEVEARGTPTSDLLTVQWSIQLDGSDVHASHADDFVLSSSGEEGVGITVGDANCDGRINVADGVCILTYLFLPPGPVCKTPCCEASEDTNNDGRINVADAVSVLGYLFLSQTMVGPDGVAITGGTGGCTIYAREDVTFPCDTPCTP
jgi:hypothetical protein